MTVNEENVEILLGISLLSISLYHSHDRLFELPETQANIAYTEQIVSPIKPIKIPPLILDRTKTSHQLTPMTLLTQVNGFSTS